MKMTPNLEEFYWPEALGQVTRKHVADSAFFLFKIESTSYGIDTQQGIIEILDYLQTHFDLRLVCLEGAEGGFIDLSGIGPTLEPGEMSSLRDELKSNVLSGPEYFAATSNLPVILYGVENREQYIKNGTALVQTHTAYKHARRVFRLLEKYVAILKACVYSEELLELDRAITQYEGGKLGLFELLKTNLLRYIDQGRLRLDEHSDLEVLIRLSRLDDAIVHSKVRPESSRLIEDIIAVLAAPRVPRDLFDRVVATKFEGQHRDLREINNLSRAALSREYDEFVDEILRDLVQTALRTRQGDLPTLEIYSSLIDLSSLCALDIRRYPSLLMYVHMLHQSNKLDRNGVVHELKLQLDELREALCENERAREAARAWRAVAGLHKLIRFDVIPVDCDRLISEFGQLSLKGLLEKVEIKDTLLPARFQRWYKAALRIDAGGEGDPGSKLEMLTALSNVRSVDSSSRGELSNEPAEVPSVAENVPEDASSSNPESLADVISVLAVDIALDGAYRFYQLAPARGRSLAENTLRQMKDRGVKVAALVSGGFLTSQITPVLERESVSYMVILPRTGVSDVTQQIYLELFSKPLDQSMLTSRNKATTPSTESR